MMGQDITLDFAKSVLKDQLREKKEQVTIDHIVETVSKVETPLFFASFKSSSSFKSLNRSLAIVLVFALLNHLEPSNR